MAVAYALKRTALRSTYHPLLLELPEYKWPNLRNLMLGLWERAKVFLQRVGTIILALISCCVPVDLPGAAGGCDGPGHPVQPRRHHRPRARARVRAARLQLADLAGTGARTRRTRSGGRALGTVYSLSATGDDVARRWYR